MKNKGLAHMGIGHGKGENKTIEAVRQAVSSPLLETTIEGATGVLLNVKGGMDLPLDQVYEAADLVKQVVDPSCNIIFGSGIDDAMNDEVEITIIATGFNDGKDNVQEIKGGGMDGIAVVSAIFAAKDIEKATADLKEKAKEVVDVF